MDLRIKDIARDKGIMLKDLAVILDMASETLSRTINGNPTVETLQKIADALNVHITELFQQPTKNTGVPEVHGFLKVDNDLHEIKSIEDLKDLYTSL